MKVNSCVILSLEKESLPVKITYWLRKYGRQWHDSIVIEKASISVKVTCLLLIVIACNWHIEEKNFHNVFSGKRFLSCINHLSLIDCIGMKENDCVILSLEKGYFPGKITCFLLSVLAYRREDFHNIVSGEPFLSVKITCCVILSLEKGYLPGEITWFVLIVLA